MWIILARCAKDFGHLYTVFALCVVCDDYTFSICRDGSLGQYLDSHVIMRLDKVASRSSLIVIWLSSVWILIAYYWNHASIYTVESCCRWYGS